MSRRFIRTDEFIGDFSCTEQVSMLSNWAEDLAESVNSLEHHLYKWMVHQFGG